MERLDSKGEIPVFNIDLSKCWDTDSQVNLIMEKLKSLGIYQKDLLFSGFDADNIGKQISSDEADDIVFCCNEEQLGDLANVQDSAMKYAMYHDNPALGLYDGQKLKWMFSGKYKIIDPSALVAVLKLKV